MLRRFDESSRFFGNFQPFLIIYRKSANTAQFRPLFGFPPPLIRSASATPFLDQLRDILPAFIWPPPLPFKVPIRGAIPFALPLLVLSSILNHFQPSSSLLLVIVPAPSSFYSNLSPFQLPSSLLAFQLLSRFPCASLFGFFFQSFWAAILVLVLRTSYIPAPCQLLFTYDLLWHLFFAIKMVYRLHWSSSISWGLCNSTSKWLKNVLCKAIKGWTALL